MRNRAVVATALLFAACGGEKLSSSRNIESASNFTLTINVAGQGTVTAAAQSMTCTSVCAQQFAAGTAVHLDASPSAGMRFLGWSGACSGTAGCDVALSQDTQVGANFGPSSLGTVSVSVVLVGTGTGHVVSTPAGIDCPATCATTVAIGTAIALSSTADAGSHFEGYGLGCEGLSCGFTATADMTVYANFGAGDSCTGLLPALPQPKTFVPPSSSGVNQQCSVGATSDGSGNVYVEAGSFSVTRTVFSSAGASVSHPGDQASGVPLFPLRSGFMIFLLGQAISDVTYTPDGTVVSTVTVPNGPLGPAADGGSFLVACGPAEASLGPAAQKFDLYRFDETNAPVSSFSWTDENAGTCPIYGGSSLIDTQNRVLILYATRPGESPMWGLPAQHLAARWFDANGTPLTDWFDAGADPAGGNILARPLIGGGAAVRVGDTWVATIPSGKAQVDPAPAFFEAKKDARIVLGGRAYAMIPDPGTAGTADVVAAGGQSCGALTTTTAADALSLGKDGTLIDSTGADACTLTYYPQVLK